MMSRITSVDYQQLLISYLIRFRSERPFFTRRSFCRRGKKLYAAVSHSRLLCSTKVDFISFNYFLRALLASTYIVIANWNQPTCNWALQLLLTKCGRLKMGLGGGLVKTYLGLRVKVSPCKWNACVLLSYAHKRLEHCMYSSFKLIRSFILF